MLQWIRARIAQMEFDSTTLNQVELASEEALVNIIHHAYQDRPEEVEIQVDAFPDNRVEIRFKDHGPPFNPIAERALDISSGLEEREIGGLGIHFIRKMMDEVRYSREGNFNVLILIKKKATRSFQKK